MLIREKHKPLRPRDQIQAMLNKLPPYHILYTLELQKTLFLNRCIY